MCVFPGPTWTRGCVDSPGVRGKFVICSEDGGPPKGRVTLVPPHTQRTGPLYPGLDTRRHSGGNPVHVSGVLTDDSFSSCLWEGPSYNGTGRRSCGPTVPPRLGGSSDSRDLSVERPYPRPTPEPRSKPILSFSPKDDTRVRRLRT